MGSMGDFIDYYHRDGFLGVVSDEDAFTPSSRMMAITRLSAFERPPSLFSCVDAKLRGDDEITYPYEAAQNAVQIRPCVLRPLVLCADYSRCFVQMAMNVEMLT